MSAEAPKAAVEDLIAKVVDGKALEASDRYYAADVTMQENEQPPRVGCGSKPVAKAIKTVSNTAAP